VASGTVSGKTALAVADLYRNHFEYSVNIGGEFRPAIDTEGLRDFWLELGYPDDWLRWAIGLPRQRGIIKEAILLKKDDGPWVLKLAEDILNRKIPRSGRWVDSRIEKRLLESLEADGFPFVDGKIKRDAVASHTSSPAPASAPATPPTKSIARQAMELAIELARKCETEPGKKEPSPKVGVVVVRDGVLLGSTHRGELKAGEHAEYTLLERKLGKATLQGATLFTTLEPCTTRNHPKHPCAQWVHKRHIATVYIGMLDPNHDICGKGQRRLRRARIATHFFDDDLTRVVPVLGGLHCDDKRAA
jgi:pyrimidine deaminase RibD-like protein